MAVAGWQLRGCGSFGCGRVAVAGWLWYDSGSLTIAVAVAAWHLTVAIQTVAIQPWQLDSGSVAT
jgi:hypothetical protein